MTQDVIAIADAYIDTQHDNDYVDFYSEVHGHDVSWYGGMSAEEYLETEPDDREIDDMVRDIMSSWPLENEDDEKEVRGIAVGVAFWRKALGDAREATGEE